MPPPARRSAPGAPGDIRWIYLHMIGEYARHNGHADLIRERIDGVTGDWPPAWWHRERSRLVAWAG
jgi:Protein of unknown function (DUF664)